MTCLLTVWPQSDPKMIKEIVEAVTIPVMAKVRIGHFVEAQVGLDIESPSVRYLQGVLNATCAVHRFSRPSESTISTNPKS